MKQLIEPYLTIDEVSEWLKIKKSTIYHWVAMDDIPSVKIGGRRRFDPVEIKKWIKKKNSGVKYGY